MIKIFTPEEIKKIRGSMSQEKFAAKIGASQEMISKMENGVSKPSRATCMLIKELAAPPTNRYQN